MHNEQQVTPHIYWVGGNDFNSPRFENLIPLKSGVTYNSYFIDDEKTAVIDTTDTVIRDLFIGNVSHLLHGRKLDYIVVNHMEPDHSGSLLALAMAYPEAKIVASAQALKMLGQYFQVSMPERYITSDEKLVIDLGMHKLRFLKGYFQQPLRQILGEEAALLSWLEGKAEKLYARKQRYGDAL